MAIETALGFALQNIVVENETAAKAAMAFCGRARGAPHFAAGHRQARQLQRPFAQGGAGQQPVTYDEKYANIVSSLLGRIVVVDDINEASRTARALDYRNRVVTVDGQVVNAGGSFTGGSVSRSAGLFSRKQEIDELKKKVEALEKQRDAAEEKTDRAKAEVDALSAELTATESEAITAGGDKIRGEVGGHIAPRCPGEAAEMLSAERAQLPRRSRRAKGRADAAAEMECLHGTAPRGGGTARHLRQRRHLPKRARAFGRAFRLEVKALAAQRISRPPRGHCPAGEPHG
ncbi:MAG: hypothetical protein ACLVJ8_05075 [Ruthenibacterium lactatiformans]